jgi:hypothetical protein
LAYIGREFQPGRAVLGDSGKICLDKKACFGKVNRKMVQNEGVPILNLASYTVLDPGPETTASLNGKIREVLAGIPGAGEPTMWRRVTGEDVLAITEFADQEAMSNFERLFVISDLFEELQSYLEESPDVDRFSVIHRQGAMPSEVPIGGYASTNWYIADVGHESAELEEAQYIIESLWQISGFLGAYVGKSLTTPGRLDSLAFWEDGEAAEKAIPIRVDTNLKMYRRVL